MTQFFELEKTSSESKARAGKIFTGNSIIETPVFMPVGTQAAVKAISSETLNELKYQIILGNTYHLYLRPGIEVLDKFKGLHSFMKWDKSILTDSGGYQVFSLQDLRKLSEEGVEFKSHIDGSRHFFSPEKVIDIQRIIGSDIMMVLDACVAYPSDKSYVEKSIDLSLLWAKSSKIQFE